MTLESETIAQLKARIAKLEARNAELEATNLDLEKEAARRGVKLNCANIALSRAKIAFDEQARHREEAVQDIAHDLRTPLTSIKGAAQNVLDGIAGPIDDGVREYLQIVLNQSVRLIGVVNWLLQAIRITSEPRTLQASPSDMTQLLSEVIEGLRPIALEKDISLEFEGDPQIGCMDSTKMHQVLDNLIGNALKFTEPGGAVTVRTEGDDAHARVMISDTGIGMDEDALERIFHRYYRANPDKEGSGLGLLIARELVRLHGGDITVRSELGKGSTFIVELPRRQPDPQAAVA
jgi:signal transduction histidine kinase